MRAVRVRHPGPRPGRWMAAIGGLGIPLFTAGLLALMGPLPVRAEWHWPWKAVATRPACGHSGCGLHHCAVPPGPPAAWGGEWFWMRSPDQEQRVVMSLYNRYCVRCHGIDSRGVWDIPDVPDFTDPRWQMSRPDPQIVNILMEGR